MNPEIWTKWVEQDESVDDLQCNGLMIIQKKAAFRFGIDAVLLSSYASARKKDKILDLGTGTGIIPLLIAGKTEAYDITGIEIQYEIADMAMRSVKMNGLSDRVKIICGDIKEIDKILIGDIYDLVVSNPPYIKEGHGLSSIYETKAIARHEILCKIDDVLSTASKMLKTGGRFAIIHRPERLSDLFCAMRNHGIEPKEMRIVHPKLSAPPVLVLVRGIKQAKSGLKVAPPLVIYTDDGAYTREIHEIYAGGSLDDW